METALKTTKILFLNQPYNISERKCKNYIFFFKPAISVVAFHVQKKSQEYLPLKYSCLTRQNICFSGNFLSFLRAHNYHHSGSPHPVTAALCMKTYRHCELHESSHAPPPTPRVPQGLSPHPGLPLHLDINYIPVYILV